MKNLFAVLAAAVLCAAPAFAQDKTATEKKAPEKKELTEQQKRMQVCNADAKKQTFKAKEDRQAFMSACLKGDQPAAAQAKTPQQEKMTQCNKDAGAKKLAGDARKKFMSDCLSG